MLSVEPDDEDFLILEDSSTVRGQILCQLSKHHAEGFAEELIPCLVFKPLDVVRWMVIARRAAQTCTYACVGDNWYPVSDDSSTLGTRSKLFGANDIAELQIQ